MVDYKIISWLDGRFWNVPRIIRLTSTCKKYIFFGKTITRSADFYSTDGGGYIWHYTDKPGEASRVDREELRNIWAFETFKSEQAFRKVEEKKDAPSEIKFVKNASAPNDG